MIRLGGLEWTYTQALEFWGLGWLTDCEAVCYLAQREIELHGVDRIGGARLLPRCPGRDAANDASEPA